MEEQAQELERTREVQFRESEGGSEQRDSAGAESAVDRALMTTATDITMTN